MEEIWTELRNKDRAVHIDCEGYESVIYKGIKAVKDEDGVLLLSTETDYYPRLSDYIVGVFLERGIEAGISEYRKDKINNMIKQFGPRSTAVKGMAKRYGN